MTKIERVGREIIDSMILKRLEEGGSVAILAQKEDLDMIIKGMGSIPVEQRNQRDYDFLEDIIRLKKEAFHQ